MDFKPEFTELIARRRSSLQAELAALLPVPGAITWEIGCGHGHFLVRYSCEYPGKTCVGVDLRSDRITRALRKARRDRLPNCHFVRTDALEFLDALPAGITLREIWVLFPDPWPKKRHHKNRLLQPEFFEAIAHRTKEGTPLYFRTDFAEYFKTVAAFLPGLLTWQLQPEAPWPFEHETVFQARAPSYQSLVALRTSHSAKPVKTTAPGLPAPTDPKSPA